MVCEHARPTIRQSVALPALSLRAADQAWRHDCPHHVAAAAVTSCRKRSDIVSRVGGVEVIVRIRLCVWGARTLIVILARHRLCILGGSWPFAAGARSHPWGRPPPALDVHEFPPMQSLDPAPGKFGFGRAPSSPCPCPRARLRCRRVRSAQREGGESREAETQPSAGLQGQAATKI